MLENGERLISEYWAAYESVEPERRQVATIKYPDRYGLKTDEDRIDESMKLSKLMNTVPGQTVKREIAKSIVQSLLGGKIPTTAINQINEEIDAAACTTSNPDTILAGVEKGLIDPETGSVALGCNPGTAAKAQQARHRTHEGDRGGARRAGGAESKSTDPVAQGLPATSDPAARGVPDLSGDLDAGALEKADSRNADLQPNAAPRVRGKGKKLARKVVEEPDSPGHGNFFEGRNKDIAQRKPFN